MGISVLVIDDFLRDPEALRTMALGLNYSETGPYPGRTSVERINLAGVEAELSTIVREPLEAMAAHGKCRIALANDNRPAKIHVDPSHWSGILYLTHPEDCRGGTEFYRHLPTGMDRVPATVEELNSAGLSSYEQLQREIIERDALDRSKWELAMSVPMRFNRLILLRAQYWHTAGPSFGRGIDDGRLVYLMFFRRAGSSIVRQDRSAFDMTDR
jgi:hypothetical protein